MLPVEDIKKLYSATNFKGEPYKIVILPHSHKRIKMKDCKEKCKGNYVNFYVGNEMVLVPQYDDENDPIALQIIKEVFPSK